MIVIIDRGENAAIPFTITDALLGLVGKRVTWAASKSDGTRVLKKQSATPGSTSEVTITTQVAGSITGTVNILPADYASMPAAQYYISLWIDDGAGNDQCVTPNGADLLTINLAAQRS